MTTIARPTAEVWQDCHDVAREQGLAPALVALRTALPPGAALLGPGGAAVVPAAEAGVHPGPVVLREAALPGGRVVLLRTGSGSGDLDPALALGAVWLRLGLSAGLLDTCLAHLGQRKSGDLQLLQLQLVQGSVAEAVIGQLQVRAELEAAHGEPLPAAVLGHLHAVLTEVDRGLLRLLGAAGYLAGGPGEVADISELLAGAYGPAEGDR